MDKYNRKGDSMKKRISIILSIVLLLLVFFTPFAEAEMSNVFTRDNLGNLAAGAAALYLFNRVSSFVSESEEMDEDISESVEMDRESELEEMDKEMSFDIIEDEEEFFQRGSGSRSNRVIVIDPGHGGFDPGAIGPGGLKEKDVALDISLKLYELLQRNTGAQVYLTRDNDVFVSLAQRVAMARNLDADMFISVHSNADKVGRKRGIETYADFNAPKNTWAFAWYIQENLVNDLRLPDRGLKANSFHVIRETANEMKAILLEIGYISHSEDEKMLADEGFQDRAAQAVYNGIVNYLSS